MFTSLYNVVFAIYEVLSAGRRYFECRLLKEPELSDSRNKKTPIYNLNLEYLHEKVIYPSQKWLRFYFVTLTASHIYYANQAGINTHSNAYYLSTFSCS